MSRSLLLQLMEMIGEIYAMTDRLKTMMEKVSAFMDKEQSNEVELKFVKIRLFSAQLAKAV